MTTLLDFAPNGQRKELRPHQNKALRQIDQSAGTGNRRIVMQAPTGFGKTLVAATLTKRAVARGKRVLFVAPAINLIDQTVRAFEAEGISDIGVMQADHPRTDSLAKVQVASVQTLARRQIPDASLVIVDECHLRAKVIEQMMDERDDVFFIGLSATPWAKGIGNRWQDLVIPCTIGELIEAGYLSQFTAYAPDVPDMSGVKVKAGDYAEGDAADVMQGKALMASVVETWLAKGENRPTLLFGVNRAHAKSLSDEFERAGVATAYVDAFTDTVERQLIERRFRSGEVKVACSVRTLTTGVDWPVSCIIDAAPTQSEMLHVQKIGRGLRVNPGTEDLLILDHAGNSLRNGLVTDIHHDSLDKTHPEERQKREKSEKLPKECANCAALHTGLICPFCGHERKPVAGVETVDGELIELTPQRSKVTKAEKQTFYGMCLWLAHERGYKRGWAANKYRDKFGIWPRGLDEALYPPDQVFLNWEKSRRIAWAKRQKEVAN
ncbi:DEAD/DEAH box helicase [Roseovarius sp.]|uniref:DEAD/DEAH box helicase n=1 Tax=Roseovarius sp. TaxID=1486281 RepID=UPI003A9822A2